MKQAEKTMKVSLSVFVYEESAVSLKIFVLFIEYFGNKSCFPHRIE